MEEATAGRGWERWVRVPRQARARETFERVLDAGAELLAEAGYAGFSMGEVCRRAGVAAGTLYGRVENKDLLFLALHDRELDRITAGSLALLAAQARAAHPDPADLVAAVVDTLARHYAAEQALLRVFILRAAVDPRVRDSGAHHVAALEEAVVALLLTRRDAYRVPDPVDAVRTVSRVVLDSLSWTTAFGSGFHVGAPDSDEERAARLADVAVAYLLGRA